MIDGVMDEMKTAMKAKDEAGLRGLRAIKAEIIKAKTDPGANGVLTEDVALKMLQKMVKQRKESADIYKSNGREDLYQVEVSEISVIDEFLPKQMSREEIEIEVKNIISNLGATSIKEMGRVMGAASKALSGRADNKIVSEIVKSSLQ